MTKQNSTSTTGTAPEGQHQDTAGTPAPGAQPVSTEGQQQAQQAPEGAQQEAEGTEGTEEFDGGEQGGNSEAAKRRRQLRETEGKLRDTEAERDTLAGTVDALRRQLVAQNMPHGSKASADLLWSAGHNPADMFTAEGAVDADKLSQAVKETHQKFGLRFGPDPIPASGTGRGDTGTDGPTWGAALDKKKR